MSTTGLPDWAGLAVLVGGGLLPYLGALGMGKRKQWHGKKRSLSMFDKWTFEKSIADVRAALLKKAAECEAEIAKHQVVVDDPAEKVGDGLAQTKKVEHARKSIEILADNVATLRAIERNYDSLARGLPFSLTLEELEHLGF